MILLTDREALIGLRGCCPPMPEGTFSHSVTILMQRKEPTSVNPNSRVSSLAVENYGNIEDEVRSNVFQQIYALKKRLCKITLS